jgi:hypothetical protein
MLLRVAAEYIPSPSPPQLMLGRHSGIGNRIRRFPVFFPRFWGGLMISRFSIPDWPAAGGDSESGIGKRAVSRFGREPGIGVPGRPPGISWSASPLRVRPSLPLCQWAGDSASGPTVSESLPTESRLRGLKPA